MYDILARRNEPTSKEALAWAQRLVSTPSASLSEGDLANEVQKQMTRLGYEQVVRDSFGNVVGTMLGREAGPTVLLACHMDTTIVGEEGDWDAGLTRGPYAMESFGAGVPVTARLVWLLKSTAARCSSGASCLCRETWWSPLRSGKSRAAA